MLRKRPSVGADDHGTILVSHKSVVFGLEQLLNFCHRQIDFDPITRRRVTDVLNTVLGKPVMDLVQGIVSRCDERMNVIW